MVRKVSSNSTINKTQKTDISSLKRSLKVGDILPARIIKQVNDSQFLINIRNIQVLAESDLFFQEKGLFVQVENLQPQLHLRLISLKQNDLNKEYLEIMKELMLPLTSFNQIILKKIISKKKKINNAKIKEKFSFFNKMKKFKFFEDVISMDDFVDTILDLSDEDFDFDLLSNLLNLSKTKIFEWKKDKKLDDNCSKQFQNNDQLSYQLLRLSAYKNLTNSNIQKIRECIKEDKLLMEYFSAIYHLNKSLNRKDKGIEAWLLPSDKGLELLVFEKKNKTLGNEKVITLQTTYISELFGLIKINLDFSGNELSVDLGFDNSIVARNFKEEYHFLQNLASENSVNLLNFKTSVYIMRNFDKVQDAINLSV